MPFDPRSTPEDLTNALLQSGRRRALFALDEVTGTLFSNDPNAAPLTAYLNGNDRDFGQHCAVFLEVGRDTGALLMAFLHRVQRGQGAGGVRHWRYERVRDALDDGLRLSRGMGRKNALAGLWWGGGKGVICRQANVDVTSEEYRSRLYRDYGAFITGLRGAYVTAEDVGTNESDMAIIHETTRFVTCVPAKVGGSGNPSASTARGVVCAMEASLEFANLGTLEGKTIAMQGTGNVGGFMIETLLERGVAKIVASEVNQAIATRVRERFTGAPVDITVVEPSSLEIFEQPCDVFAPNALGGTLNAETIPRLRCPIVCGAANNQLLDDQQDDTRLSSRGIHHVPDYVANRMGIVQCANEQYGVLPDDPAIHRHFDPSYANSVHRVTLEVLQCARREGISSTRAANALADERMALDHPMWPRRTQDIIDALVRLEWDKN